MGKKNRESDVAIFKHVVSFRAGHSIKKNISTQLYVRVVLKLYTSGTWESIHFAKLLQSSVVASMYSN